jgi:hypothetical protein
VNAKVEIGLFYGIPTQDARLEIKAPVLFVLMPQIWKNTESEIWKNVCHYPLGRVSRV